MNYKTKFKRTAKRDEDIFLYKWEEQFLKTFWFEIENHKPIDRATINKFNSRFGFTKDDTSELIKQLKARGIIHRGTVSL